ncbi:outer membrane protein assembly factor BamA [Halocynthiibacter styelae]|uniref:Outer membrane protein assembly factor BamA n=1 Tax=Halocynthiibacter styelae TaxID=2761955 RepID=A0A8J7IHN6_9RHOB|nr:outer membrane protein assembly factor BamA [Paenihalocynthiibacter styelae]MBI1492323.1 outer membrane protein assembly factor BamA [Paenihalocynthiibacter styelae]
MSCFSNTSASGRKSIVSGRILPATIGFFLLASTASVVVPDVAYAQQYRFSTVEITGNQRIESGTILTYAGIGRGERVSAAELNDAYQRILASGLFESVEIIPQGNQLVIRVVEFPTVNRISIEGNRRLKDEDLMAALQSQPRRVFSPAVAEADAQTITEVYSAAGRLAATVEPKIIRRSNNRVDLVFEITEGRVVEVERLSFVGNRAFSERRLRRVLETKQAGIFRELIRSDSFIADRVEFDKQVLRDFYLSRGYVDFETLSVNSELVRARDGFLVTFNIREGQQFRVGEVTVVSDLEEADPDLFMDEVRMRSGAIYSPSLIEENIARLERLAIREEIDFVRVEPRVTRNDADLTLDVEYVLTRGPRVFVERIDIEGNNTTLDRVVRNRFRVVEGDPFNPREIRESAERVRALGYFSNADVNAREGSTPDQVVIDVDVEEQPTGSLSFGASYSADSGAAFTIGFSERNFLGRGQSISVDLNTASSSQSGTFRFVEPNLLGRDLAFGLDLGYVTTDSDNATFDTRRINFTPSLTFPVSQNGRLRVYYTLEQNKIFDVDNATASALLIADEAAGTLTTSALGYNYSFDTRRTGLNPDAGVVLRFGQEFAGLGGDAEYIRTTALLGAETKAWNGDVTLRGILEGGIHHSLGDTNSTVLDRFRHSSSQLRGFSSNGIGPYDSGDHLGGNYYAYARLEADFPLGLPEEYGISGGLFLDAGSVWGLDDNLGGTISDDFELRATVGFSIFWDTPLGPLRFNFSQPLKEEANDDTRSFDLTISTQF